MWGALSVPALNYDNIYILFIVNWILLLKDFTSGMWDAFWSLGSDD